MAPICIGVINLFGVDKGSNIGRGIFLLMTYTCAIFDKMIIAGTGAITARNVIERIGEVDVTYSFWLLAFFPCAIVTILVGWRLALWLFPPEIESLENRKPKCRPISERLRLDADAHQVVPSSCCWRWRCG
jgi:di/tricarboxylate transporter